MDDDGESNTVKHRQSDVVVARFAPRRLPFVYGLVMGGIGVMFGVTVCVVASKPMTGEQEAMMAIWGVVAFFALVATWAAVRAGTLRTALTSTHLRYPKAFWGWNFIPLAEISGVGLWYQNIGRGTFGWVLMVWKMDHDPRGIQVAPSPHGAPRGQRPSAFRHPFRVIKVPPMDWDYLAARPAGRAALLINQQVLAAQGTTGTLAMQHRQTIDATTGVSAKAYWSPDGRCGAMTWVPPFHQRRASRADRTPAL
jgi:hypothetical protein